MRTDIPFSLSRQGKVNRATGASLRRGLERGCAFVDARFTFADTHGMSSVRHLTDSDFKTTVLDADHPVLVDFWAAWCGPCRMMAPEIEKLAERFGDRVEVAKMDIDAEPAVAGGLGIMSIPTLVLFSPGTQPRGLTGFRTAEQIDQALGLSAMPTMSTPASGD